VGPQQSPLVLGFIHDIHKAAHEVHTESVAVLLAKDKTFLEKKNLEMKDHAAQKFIE
jgi:hypothetical protein